jgi:hypothetical protein
VSELVHIIKHTTASKSSKKLPTLFCFLYNTAKTRILRLTQINEVGVPVGHHSPLRDCEDDIFDIIIKLGKIRCPLTCGQAIQLIDQLIDNTVHQERLVDWKMLHGLDQPMNKLKKSEILTGILFYKDMQIV